MPETVVVTTKKLRFSKTFWISVVGGAIALGDILMGFIGSGGFLPDQAAEWLMLIMGVLGVIMRWLTSQPIQGSSGAEQG